jgi:uncharacterized NAD(P)/FAD-binding protein YdhS
LASVAGRWRVTLAGQSRLDVDAVVLAVGNFAPACAWAPPELRASGRFVADPWGAGALGRIRRGQPVLLVGTALTMADVALTLASRATASLVAVSRHGLLPSVHAPELPAPAEPPELPTGRLRLDEARGAFARQAARLGSTQAAVDSMRPVTPDVWQRLFIRDRHEFLRRYARRWDVLRHRMAPEVGAELDRLRDTGRLMLRAGGLDARWQGFGAVVNCTGPRTDLRNVGDPLLDRLFAAGLARPDALALGLDTNVAGVVVDAAGVRNRGLWAVGPPRRGGLWESTAIPEIRVQAAEVAQSLMDQRPTW